MATIQYNSYVLKLIGTAQDYYDIHAGLPIPTQNFELYELGGYLNTIYVKITSPIDKNKVVSGVFRGGEEPYFEYQYADGKFLTQYFEFDGVKKVVIDVIENPLIYNYKSSYLWGEHLKTETIKNHVLNNAYIVYENGNRIALTKYENPEIVVTTSLGDGDSFYLDHTITSATINVDVTIYGIGTLSYSYDITIGDEQSAQIDEILLLNGNKNLYANQFFINYATNENLEVEVTYADGQTENYTYEQAFSYGLIDIKTFNGSVTEEYWADGIQYGTIYCKGEEVGEYEYGVTYFGVAQDGYGNDKTNGDTMLVYHQSSTEINYGDIEKRDFNLFYYDEDDITYDEDGNIIFDKFGANGVPTQVHIRFSGWLRKNQFVNEEFSTKIEETNLTIYRSDIKYKLDRNIDFSSTNDKYNIIFTLDYNVDGLTQPLKATLPVVIRYKTPTHLEQTFEFNEYNYWDSGVSVFKGSNYTIKVKYDNNDLEDLPDDSLLEFYARKSKDSKQFIRNETLISPKDLVDNKLWCYYPDYDVWGETTIVFHEDTISTLTIDESYQSILGNSWYYNNNEIATKIIVTYASGRTTTLAELGYDKYNYVNEYNFNFDTKEIIPLKVNINDVIYEIENITYVTPEIGLISPILNGFPTEYSNGAIVDIRNIQFYVEYKNSSFKETISYPNYTITTSDNLSLLPTDGSQKINVTFEDGVSRIVENIEFTVTSVFASNETRSYIIDIGVNGIDKITGITVTKAYTDYKVGDLFLNDKDKTEVTIYYEDALGKQGKVENIRLNSGYSLLNILPLKGTEFKNYEDNKVIRISYIGNPSVYTEYTINVGSKLVSQSTTKTHRIVTAYLDCEANGVTPSEESVAEEIDRHYILIKDEIYPADYLIESLRNQPTTIIRNGIREINVVSDNFRIVLIQLLSNNYVIGYLENVGDVTASGRVILFEDYKPPIQNESNIEVKFQCYVDGNADYINKCKFGIMFGNNSAKNRLFVSGNPKYANVDWHTGEISSSFEYDEQLTKGNLGYFEDLSYMNYGETDNKIVGYSIVSNDRLLVLKDYSDKETTIYYRTPTLIQALDGAGNTLTDITGNLLYQEAFPLSKSNSNVGGISSSAIKNLNGDTLFISHDNQVVGLDILGITGDNQRVANTRSYYIDNFLKNQDMSKAWLWCDTQDLYLILNDRIFATNTNTKVDNQYEWYQMDVSNVSEIVEINNIKYVATHTGKLYRVDKESYVDVNKTFIEDGDAQIRIDDTVLIINQEKLKDVKEDEVTTFKINKNSQHYLYHAIATFDNRTDTSPTLYIDTTSGNNYFELSNDNIKFKQLFGENEYIYFQVNEYIQSNVEHDVKHYVRYKMKSYESSDTFNERDLYKVYDENDNEVNLLELKNGQICYRMDKEYKVVELNLKNSSFKLEYNGEIVDVIKYADQSSTLFLQAEIRHYRQYEKYYITKPYFNTSLNSFKTIWSWNFVNDVKEANKFQITYANNKIPYHKTMTMFDVGENKMAFSFEDLSFVEVDFEKNIVPRTYTSNRVVPKVKFICFGFKNNENSNMILTSMNMTYTYSYPSY